MVQLQQDLRKSIRGIIRRKKADMLGWEWTARKMFLMTSLQIQKRKAKAGRCCGRPHICQPQLARRVVASLRTTKKERTVCCPLHLPSCDGIWLRDWILNFKALLVSYLPDGKVHIFFSWLCQRLPYLTVLSVCSWHLLLALECPPIQRNHSPGLWALHSSKMGGPC